MTNEPQIDWPERLREWNTFYPTDITTRALEAYDRLKGERDKLKRWQDYSMIIIDKTIHYLGNNDKPAFELALRLQKEAE